MYSLTSGQPAVVCMDADHLLNNQNIKYFCCIWQIPKTFTSGRSYAKRFLFLGYFGACVANMHCTTFKIQYTFHWYSGIKTVKAEVRRSGLAYSVVRGWFHLYVHGAIYIPQILPTCITQHRDFPIYSISYSHCKGSFTRMKSEWKTNAIKTLQQHPRLHGDSVANTIGFAKKRSLN